ncbi:MAG: diaminopimelate decarboxylase [Syntrophobacterales bacterium]|jgi:diaminopimelate decarboxylase|nr:diaminopimelate decarboxylase [Syntrophobacterales bacterium]
MNYCQYRNGELYCEDVPVAKIAKATGTPVYIYSYKTLERRFLAFEDAFRATPHLTCYSCKACSNLSILKIIGSLGGGVDIVSGGELFRALKAGISGRKTVFSGVGKTEEEIVAAVKADVLMINVESEDELDVVGRVASRMKKAVPVSVRVNPEIDAKTHPYITTGLKKNKFGVPWDDAFRLYKKTRNHKYLNPVGISSHIGSQILDLAPFVEAVRFLKAMVLRLFGEGIKLSYIDIGGGLGITYKDELPPDPEDYGRVVGEELKETGFTAILEPGRVLIGNSGIFVTRLLYVKRPPGKTFYVIDGAMNDLVRPSLYGAYHKIIPAKEGGRTEGKVDIVGPICESGDFLAKDREMPYLEKNELLAVMGAGAYGFSMSSNYNSRRRVAEVLVKGGEFAVIRKRETYKDLIRGESIPSFLEV